MREQDFAVQILIQLGILEIAYSGFIDSAQIGAVVDDDRTVFKFCTLHALFPGQRRAKFSFQKQDRKSTRLNSSH